MHVFTMPAENWNELNPDKQIIRKLIIRHAAIASRMHNNIRYYKGEHKILSEEDRENKLVCNHAKDIADTASSYFIGNPVSYKAKYEIDELTDALENAGADEADGDNGLDLSIYGLAYEYIYAKEGDTDLTIKNLSAEHTFMVKDDSIEENELFAVYYYVRKDDTGQKATHYMATVVSKNYKYELDISDSHYIQEFFHHSFKAEEVNAFAIHTYAE